MREVSLRKELQARLDEASGQKKSNKKPAQPVPRTTRDAQTAPNKV
jgi:hypothetical protein